nr:metabotropic glutamate receptor 3-like isoform X2 [Ciona intestinalis]|eukprot:XP_026690611.1 metabotropic glutamate receptor 3-like isoform X2 [Ciona intestinalis]
MGLFHRYHEVYSMEGDIMLAGLFPIHQNEGCLDLEDMGSIQRMEAMAYAVQKVNSWPNFMKNFTLGFRIFDTCNSQSIALSRTLGVLPHCNNCTHYPVCFPECPSLVAGIVGPESSSNALLSAHACNLALTPIISYFATSLELTDKTIFPTLFTTVPSDDFQVSAMLELLEYFGWTYFSFIHTNDRYGKDALDYVQTNMKEMCLASVQQVSGDGSNSSYDEVVTTLLRYKDQSQTSVVIVFTDGVSANKLFCAVDRANATGEFVWIGSEGWGVSLNDISDNLHVAQGSLTFTPHTEIDPEFDEYFQNLNVTHNNPWWKEIWKDHFNCNWTTRRNEENSCWNYKHIDETNGYLPDSTVSLVNDAVYAFAYAISDYVNHTDDIISENGDVIVPPWKLINYIRKISFPGSAQRREITLGKSIAYYDLNNLQINENGTFDYVRVGSWDSVDGLILDASAIQWPDHRKTPISYCSEFCHPGEVQVLIKIACCWDCERCAQGSIVVNNTRCQECQDFYWPNSNYSRCVPLELEYLHWYEAPAVLLSVFACVVLLCAVFTSIYYIRHRHDRLIMASGRELMSVIMFGVIIQCVMVFFIIAKPTEHTCFIYRFIFGLDLTISYAAIVVKSNRIFRIFTHGLKSVAPPRWTKTHHQLLITGCIVLIQIIVVSSLCLIFPPKVVKYQAKPGLAELACSLDNNVTILLPLSYNFLLIVPCLYYGWKTRNLPANFNESRFIAFTVSTTLVVWIAFIPTYLTVGISQDTSSKIHVEILATVEIMSAANTLACLFLPKIYALKFLTTTSWHVAASFKTKGRRNNSRNCENCGSGDRSDNARFRKVSFTPFVPRDGIVGIQRLGIRRASSAGDATTTSKKVSFPSYIEDNIQQSDILRRRSLSVSAPDITSLMMTSSEERPSLWRSKTEMDGRSNKVDAKKEKYLSPVLEIPSFELRIATPKLKRRSIKPDDDSTYVKKSNSGTAQTKTDVFLKTPLPDFRRVSNASAVSNIDVMRGSVTDNYTLGDADDVTEHPNHITPSSPTLKNGNMNFYMAETVPENLRVNIPPKLVENVTPATVFCHNDQLGRARSSSDAAGKYNNRYNSPVRRVSIPGLSYEDSNDSSPPKTARVVAYSVTKIKRRKNVY